MPLDPAISARVAELDRLLVDFDQWCAGYRAGNDRLGARVENNLQVPIKGLTSGKAFGSIPEKEILHAKDNS